MDQARQVVSTIGKDYDSDRCDTTTNDFSASNVDSPRSGSNKPSSVASFASLSHHAKSIVGTFSCNGEREFSERYQKGGNRISSSRTFHSSSGRSSPRQSMNRSPPRYSQRGR